MTELEGQREHSTPIDDTNYRSVVFDEISRQMNRSDAPYNARKVHFSWKEPTHHISGFQTMGERVIDIVRDIQRQSPQFNFEIFGTPSDHTVTHIEVRFRRRR